MRASRQSTIHGRRGLTLVEMLVVAGLMVLVMAILVSVFTAATGAITVSRTYATLDQEIRRANTLLRQDLAGVTAKMTPPLNPADGLGYFTYGENALADLQGEDTDDYLAFTAKAPPGQPFAGTIAVAVAPPGLGFIRVPVTSNYAEIIYFIRNNNLYRRVFLIAPERQYSLTTGLTYGGGFFDGRLQSNVSWQAWNDISARPSPYGSPYTPIANTLGDLTNRENRAFSMRFANDYASAGGVDAMGNITSLSTVPDQLPDDYHSVGGFYIPDGIPDYVPTMYPQLFSATRSDGSSLTNFPIGQPSYPGTVSANAVDLLAFPYLYVGAYSAADPNTISYGPTHSLDPSISPIPTGTRPNFGSALDPPYNHGPLDLGDPLGTPGTFQTYWGFPTKKETLSQYWTDPVKRINDQNGGLPTPSIGAGGTGTAFQQSPGLSIAATTLLPPLTGSYRVDPQPYNDGAGSTTFITGTPGIWSQLTEDDLILTNVRSFDVKAYDPVLGDYADLGYLNMYAGTPYFVPGTTQRSLETLAHEGRMPPLTADYRADAQYPALSPNIGDDQTSVLRMRRVWDSWSTDYTYVPSQSLYPAFNPPYSLAQPALPSYPPPYEVPLRGIQIQIRVVDPKNERIKLHTIRQDFSDRL